MIALSSSAVGTAVAVTTRTGPHPTGSGTLQAKVTRWVARHPYRWGNASLLSLISWDAGSQSWIDLR